MGKSEPGVILTGKGEVTELLENLTAGDLSVGDELMERVYRELHRIAMRRLHMERREHTLQATALVNEAYMRLCGKNNVAWLNRAHFFSVAARTMRRVLVDYARQRGAKKRGDGQATIQLDEAIVVAADQTELALELDELLKRLARLSPRQAQVAEMRFFAGRSDEEIAAALGVEQRTVRRDWAMARAWLHQQLTTSAAGSGKRDDGGSNEREE